MNSRDPKLARACLNLVAAAAFFKPPSEDRSASTEDEHRLDSCRILASQSGPEKSPLRLSSRTAQSATKTSRVMSLNQLVPAPMSEPDDSTVCGAMTPPESAADFLEDQDPLGTPKLSTSSVPWPGSTFIIRSALTGQVLTLDTGRVLLCPPGGRGSIHWACVDAKGWLGFRNVVSGRFLGHDKGGKLRCEADRVQEWEKFCVRMTPEGGFVLLMTHWERLWQVGTTVERGVEKLAKVGEAGIVWEFVKT